jgi:hypothetical protein
MSPPVMRGRSPALRLHAQLGRFKGVRLSHGVFSAVQAVENQLTEREPTWPRPDNGIRLLY